MPTTTSGKTNRRVSERTRQRVILGKREYEKMRQELEDLQDALTYETAKRTARGFTLRDEFIEELKAEGKLK